MEELEKTIREKLEELRVHLQNDGGDLEIVSIEGKEVRLALKGACGCCPHATMKIKTRSGFQARKPEAHPACRRTGQEHAALPDRQEIVVERV